MLKLKVPAAGRKWLLRQRLEGLCRFLDMMPARYRVFFAAKRLRRKQQQLQRKTARRT
jgi:hypothetical protein